MTMSSITTFDDSGLEVHTHEDDKGRKLLLIIGTMDNGKPNSFDYTFRDAVEMFELGEALIMHAFNAMRFEAARLAELRELEKAGT